MGNSKVCKKCGKLLRNKKGKYCGSCKSKFFADIRKKGGKALGVVASVLLVIVTKGKKKP